MSFVSFIQQAARTSFQNTSPAFAPPKPLVTDIIDRLKDRIADVLQAAANAAARPPLDTIAQTYQVRDDQMTEFRPQFGPFPINIPFVSARPMTQTEADLLGQLQDRRGLNGLRQFRDITSNDQSDPGLAFRTADRYVPRVTAEGQLVVGGEDGHNDAFRHAYWNALMVDRFGADFAAAFGTAHEGVPGNPMNKEAMDLYNNEVGRTIAAENPGASDEELADLVFEALESGELLVIDAAGDLAWSDQVEIGQTGSANQGQPAPGVMDPPEWNSN